MLAITLEILTEKFRIPYISELSIDSRQDLLMDICTFSFPNRIDKKGKKILDFIKIGDKITVNAGYNGRKTTRFVGYISKIMPGRDCLVECLDEGYPFSFLSVEKSVNLKKTTFSKLLNAIAPSIKLNIRDADIGDWEIQKDTPVFKVIEELKQKFNILPFFRNGILTFAKTDLTGGILLDFQKNMPLEEDDLSLYLPTQSLYYIKGTSEYKEGGKTKVITVFFDKNGSSKQAPKGVQIGEVRVKGITEGVLIELCKNKLNAINQDGLTGECTTFGEPYVRHGQTAQIKDLTRPDFEGNYYIKSVLTTFNEDGLLQKIGIGSKL